MVMTGNKRKAMAPEIWIDEKDLPSEATQSWKARKSGPTAVVKLIDEIFAERITFTAEGVKHSSTIFREIFLQLYRKAMRGDKRARRVFMMYQTIGFGKTDEDEPEVQLVYVENDYTRMMKANFGKRAGRESEDPNG
jgi:hypothetical protein